MHIQMRAVHACRYLERVDAAVHAAKERTEGPITLLAHSAGGWLARVYLLVGPNMSYTKS